jgi:putative transposase
VLLMLTLRDTLGSLLYFGNMHEYKQFYRRKLPHLHTPGSTLFVTFRLANSIPQSVIAQYKYEKQFIDRQLSQGIVKSDNSDTLMDARSKSLKEFHRKWFQKFEEILHLETTGPMWLKRPEIAQVIYDGLIHRNGVEYDLRAFCIMSNHVHSVFRPYLSEKSLKMIKEAGPPIVMSTDPTIGVIMRSLKGYTARKANQILERSGQFWEAESFDREIRAEGEFGRTIRYVLQNPVKANLVDDWRKWQWTWLADDLQEYY